MILLAHFLSHRMEDFRQEFLKFGSIRATYSKIPWVVLTHNASEDVFNDVVENLQLHEPVAKFTESSFQKNLYYDIVFKDTLLAIRKDLYEHLKGFVISCLQIDDNDNSGNKVMKFFSSIGSFKKTLHCSRTKNRVASFTAKVEKLWNWWPTN